LDGPVAMEIDEVSEVDTVVVEALVEVKDTEIEHVAVSEPAAIKRKALDSDSKSSLKNKKKAKKENKKVEAPVVAPAVEEEETAPMVVVIEKKEVAVEAPVVVATTPAHAAVKIVKAQLPVKKTKAKKVAAAPVVEKEEVIIAPVAEEKIVAAPIVSKKTKKAKKVAAVPVVEKKQEVVAAVVEAKTDIAPIVEKKEVVEKKTKTPKKKQNAFVEHEPVVDEMAAMEIKMNEEAAAPVESKSKKVKMGASIDTMATPTDLEGAKPATPNVVAKRVEAKEPTSSQKNRNISWGPNKVKEFDLKMSLGAAPVSMPVSPGQGVLIRREAGFVDKVNPAVESIKVAKNKKRVGKGGKRR
jgi:hypothetical protein